MVRLVLFDVGGVLIDLQSEKARRSLESEYGIGLIPKNWTVEKCSSAQVKGAEGNEEKSVQ